MTNYGGIIDVEVILMSENKENKIDGYIKISNKEKNINEISNIIETTNNLGKKTNEAMIKAIQPLINASKSISQIYINQAIQSQKLFTSMIEPLTELSKKITELIQL